jgi:hypothetical protein
MSGPGVGEILDHGPERESPAWLRVGTIAAAVALVCIVAVVAVNAWLARDPTSGELSIVDVTVMGESPVTVVSEPPLGALTTPSGTHLPGLDLRLRVGGDPAAAVEVIDDTTDSIAHVTSMPPTVIPAGGYVDIDTTVAPSDCGAIGRIEGGLDLLTTSEGMPVPMSGTAQQALAEALDGVCRLAGDAPVLTVTSARYGRPPALDSIRLTVDVAAQADRLVLTPLDTPGLRGLGSADRRRGDDIPLLWLLTAPRDKGQGSQAPVAEIQVYVVRDGTAYPWIAKVALTDDLPPWVPGVQGALAGQSGALSLAEAAPRPGY